MRELLGDPLLVWTRGGFQPTERALELHATVQEALGALEAAFRAPEDFRPAQATGVLNIGLGAHLETVIAGPLLQRLAEEAPEVIPRLHRFTAPSIPSRSTTSCSISPSACSATCPSA
ncbi:hypothetical protein [Vannielia sp.]|uniref:hypothetical protein n=1 Tax=Vannielia sp. TaxID=2813045 RepID=UPI002610B5A3|nr:hypothetical protein [Vannielia sp.]MDF1872341.1 hypothetical protein [Vannielia sp.]